MHSFFPSKMKKILNFGSINIDYVYTVPHFVKGGETLASSTFQTFLGGKGCNQSVALAKAGLLVYHAGNIHQKNRWILQQLKESGVNTSYISAIDKPTGHAIIQVTPNGENAIFLHGGANLEITTAQIDSVFQDFSKGDYLLIQNEINHIPTIINQAAAKGMRIFFNPAPMNSAVLKYPLEKVNLFILNEVEGKELAGVKKTAHIIPSLQVQFPDTAILLTLGSKGAVYQHKSFKLQVKANKVKVVDTTAAGDTFIGYFMAEWIKGGKINNCLEIASKAAAITVSRKGGAISIPERDEIEQL